MAAEISVYSAIGFTVNGEPIGDIGSITAPVKEAAAEIADGSESIRRRVKVPAGEMVTAWEWANTSGFTLARFAVVGGEGYVHIGVRYNSPTSDDDLTPTGSINQWETRGMSCVGDAVWDTERAYIHATAATAVGQTDGAPTVWSSGSKVLGVADKIMLYNTGDEDVVVDMFIASK